MKYTDYLIRYAEDNNKDDNVIWSGSDELIPADIDLSAENITDAEIIGDDVDLEDTGTAIQKIEDPNQENQSANESKGRNELPIEKYQFETLVIVENGKIYLPVKAEAADDETMRISVNMIVKEGKNSNTYPLLTNYADTKWKKYRDPINYVAYVRKLAYAWYKKYAAEYYSQNNAPKETIFKPVKNEYKDFIDEQVIKTTVVTDKYSTGYIAIAVIQGPGSSTKNQNKKLHFVYPGEKAPDPNEIKEVHDRLHEQILEPFYNSPKEDVNTIKSDIILNDMGGLSKVELRRNGSGYLITLGDGYIDDSDNFVATKKPAMIPIFDYNRAVQTYQNVINGPGDRKNNLFNKSRSLTEKLLHPKETIEKSIHDLFNKSHNKINDLGDKAFKGRR